MKKLDGFVIRAFIGPFILTTAVVVFILLIQQMIQYIDELLGKGLSYLVFAELLFYFSLHIVPLAMPLAVLLSSLITFGNLGEHGELTAMKANGISLVRVLMPIFVFSVAIAVFSFWFNDQIVPQANLRAYSLLWDIKQKSPTLSIKEGAFYNGLEGYSIKINKKFEDGKTIKDVMIYDHTKNQGNRELILADSGKMYTIHHERYLVLELFDGKSYHDQVGAYDGNRSAEKFIKNSFEKSQIIFSLASFDMDTTNPDLFKNHRIMRDIAQLTHDIDSLQKKQKKTTGLSYQKVIINYSYHLKDFPKKKSTPVKPVKNIPANTTIDSLVKSNIKKEKNNKKNSKNSPSKISTPDTDKGKQSPPKKPKNPIKNKKTPAKIRTDSLIRAKRPIKTNPNPQKEKIMASALSRSRNLKAVIDGQKQQLEANKRRILEFSVEMYKKFTLAFACITMFFIGAPLGAIIKKGGLGLPVLISIIFFIVFYVMSITGEKWVKEAFTPIIIGMWFANVLLFSIGMFFLRQARNDSRILEADFYYVLRDRVLDKIRKKDR